MYTKFIEVHDKDTDMLLSFNADKITVFGDQIIDTDREGFEVAESYDELKKLIEDCGCLIHRKHPRLDLEHPLTWDDLCRLEMIGEPVWNSNSQRWMLIIDSASDNTWIDLVNHAGGKERWIGHDARKFPLYRMKKQ